MCQMCDTHYLDGKIKTEFKNKYGIFILEESRYYENMFLLFLAKLQFDFDVQIQTPGV